MIASIEFKIKMKRLGLIKPIFLEYLKKVEESQIIRWEKLRHIPYYRTK